LKEAGQSEELEELQQLLRFFSFKEEAEGDYCQQIEDEGRPIEAHVIRLLCVT
jgi:hypothetical protein